MTDAQNYYSQDRASIARAVKTVSGKVVAQSIAFRMVSIYWKEVAPFPWYLNERDRPPLEAPALHTLRLIARQPWRHCVTSLRSVHWLASSLKLAARCPVSGCWPSFSQQCCLHCLTLLCSDNCQVTINFNWKIKSSLVCCNLSYFKKCVICIII